MLAPDYLDHAPDRLILLWQHAEDDMLRDVARHEKPLIPDDFEYSDLTGLTLEAREKLARIRPKNLGQAGRIPGVSPSDVAQLSIALAARGK